MREIVKTKTKDSGDFYAFKNKNTKTVFKNKLKEAKLIELNNDDIVVDIGAYVGEYSLWASYQNVKEVHSYEATPETFKVLEMNKRDNMFLHQKAVVGSDDKYIDFYVSDGIGVTNGIRSYNRRNSTKISVPAIRYEDAVKNASVVKIDVEGAEYSYNILQSNLRGIILEFHRAKGDWKVKAREIAKELELNGFKRLCFPEFKHGFDMHACWVR